jgi:hypothetical protein
LKTGWMFLFCVVLLWAGTASYEVWIKAAWVPPLGPGFHILSDDDVSQILDENCETMIRASLGRAFEAGVRHGSSVCAGDRSVIDSNPTPGGQDL